MMNLGNMTQTPLGCSANALRSHPPTNGIVLTLSHRTVQRPCTRDVASQLRHHSASRQLLRCSSSGSTAASSSSAVPFRPSAPTTVYIPIASDPPPPVAAPASTEEDDGPVLKWFEKPCLWTTVHSLAELEAELSGGGDRHIAVDFFAGWCSSCKGAFPALCKIPRDEALSSRFKFIKANIEDEEVYKFVKKMSAGGIPYMAVYSPAGQLVMGMTASFKRIAQLKSNLAVIAENPDATRFVLNPQGDAEPA